MITYQVPPGVRPEEVRGRPLLSTPQGGRVAVDRLMLETWRQAAGRSLEEALSGGDTLERRAALACLVEAGLLQRTGEAPRREHPVEQDSRQDAPVRGPLVSAVVVSYNSRAWLEACFASLFSQTYAPIEAILVDNGSQDGSADWAQAHYPQVQVIRLDRLHALSHAINTGIQAARGEFFLLLNPDVRLSPQAVARLVAVGRGDPACAAVATKLTFTWAPVFLNGLGNRVGAFSWGSDNGLGSLDLGQFDGWREAPSACFAAALLPRPAWQAVGPLDERLLLYYEDSEWCYRARLLGLRVLAAPQAVVEHAFTSQVPTGSEPTLSKFKLERVVFGRLLFAVKLLGRAMRTRFLLAYALEDLARAVTALARLDGSSLRAIFTAWRSFFAVLPALRRERNELHARRRCTDSELFCLQALIPPTRMWRGLPELTWDLVQHAYLPDLLAGRARPAPELPTSLSAARLPRAGRLARLRSIWQQQGMGGLLHHLWRSLQWKLSLP